MRQIFLILCFFVGFTLSVLVGVSYAEFTCPVGQVATKYRTLPGFFQSGCTSVYCPDRTAGAACTIDPSLKHVSEGWQDDNRFITFIGAPQYNSQYAACRQNYKVDYYECQDLPPERSNGIKDPDEEGIDCGYEGGPACEKKCPDGYALSGDKCIKSLGPASDVWPSLVGKPHPNDPSQTVQPDTPIYSTEAPVTPISAGPGVNVPDSAFSIPESAPPSTDIVQSGQDDTTTISGGGGGNGDYVIKDGLGNVKGFKQTNESSKSNDDGTTTHVHTTTVYNPETGQNTTTTTETVTDDTTGETISSKTSYSGKGSGGTSTGTAVQNGMGSSDGVTGDQYSSGVGTITGAVKDSGKGIEEAIGKLGEKLDGIGDGITAIGSGDDDGEDDLGEFTAPSDEFSIDEGEDAPTEEDYDSESLIDDFIDTHSNIGWLNFFSDSQIQTSSTTCSIDGNVSIGSSSVPISLSLCSFESVFQSLGILFAVIAQLSALIIAFTGFD